MNDWIVAGINNPDFTPSDFHNIAGMDINNTQLKSRDFYLKSNYIRNNDLFKDNEGNFSESLFDKYYDSRLNSFLEFLNGKFQGLELDMFDTNRTADSKIRDDNFEIGRMIANPDRQKIGVEGINLWSNPEKSRSEIALMNQIWDYDKQEFRDYSPNDTALFNGKKDYGSNWLKSLWDDPLVMAAWEEDGTHIDPITGQETHHKKGDYKLNNKGTYYYETLGGRSTVGKNVLSALDTLTVDGSAINKYDFFDSDDIEKSVGGVIAKNVAALVPIFTPIGGIYSSALIAREMAKSLPMLYGVATALFGDYETPKWMNTVAAMGEKFSGGTSDYAKEHSFSVENLGNMIADVALQWGLQKQIAKAFDSLRGIKNNYMDDVMKNAEALYNVKKTQMPGVDPQALMNACIKKFLPEAEKAALKAGQLGRDMSLAYMAIVSNSDVYNDMLEHGASRREAAAVALGSTLGMFAVDKTGIGEAFFEDATDETTKAVRSALKNELKTIRESGDFAFKEIASKPGNKLLAYINKAADISKRFFNDYAEDIKNHTLTGLQKMGAEGVEEVSEELVSDTFKAIYELAGKFGADTTVKDVGAWDNAWDRYSMSFLGGALGGGIFYGKELWDGRNYKQDKSNEELATLIRNGHVDDIRSMVLDMKNKGKFGSTKLSGTKHEIGEDNKPIWLTTDDKKESQNDVIANLINDKINSLDTIINNNQIGLSDDLLFTQMVLGETRYDRYKDIAHITNYYLDFNNVVNNLITAELNLRSAEKTLSGTVDGPKINSDQELRSMTDEKKAERALNLQILQSKLDEARNAKNEFLSGDTSLDYTRKLNFAIDPNLHSAFLPIDELLMWEAKFKDKNQDDITLEDYALFRDEVEKAKKEYLKNNLTESWKRFKDIEKVVVPELSNLAQLTPEFKNWHSKFINTVFPKLKRAAEQHLLNRYKWDSILPEETQQEFDLKDTIGIILELDETGEAVERNETLEEFNNRKIARYNKITELNNQLDLDYANAIRNELSAVNFLVDPLVHRMLLGPTGLIAGRIKDVIDVVKAPIRDGQVLQSLVSLKSDLSNVDDVILDMTDRKTNSVLSKVNSIIENIMNTTIVYNDGTAELMSDYSVGNSDPMDGQYNQNVESTIQQFIDGTADDQFNEDTKIKLSSLFTELKAFIGDKLYGNDITLENITRDNWVYTQAESEIVNNIKNTTNDSINQGKNQIQQAVLEIKNNPFYKLNLELKATVKNPVVELVKKFAGKVIDQQTMPEIETLLNAAQDIYEGSDSVEDWVLDETQMKAMETTENLLKLVNTYLYAASSSSNIDSVVGHNKVMNEYAKNHSDVITSWNELPELDADYAMLYQNLMLKYANIFKTWKEFSNNHQINKKNLFQKSDKAFNKALWDVVQTKMDNGAFKVNVDDKDYNLLEGLTSAAGQDNLILRYNVERILYKNFQDALSDSKLSAYEFLEKSKLLDSLISEGFNKQDVSKFDDKVTKDTLTSFDKYQYFAMILTQDPSKFYQELKDRTKGNSNIAPISVQEYAARLSKAATNQQFRDIMRYGHVKSGDVKAGMYNTAIISGVAGAGKTQVAVKGATSQYTPEQLWALGPTDKQANSLRDSINAGTKNTIEEALEKIIGKDTLSKLKTSVDSVGINSNGKSLTADETDFFTVGIKDGFVYAKLKEDSIKFTDVTTAPKMIVIDEATHANSLYALIFDLYMRQNNGTLLLVGDPNQRGYSNKRNLIGNIEELDVFAARAPKLTVSLRDNNIQKQYNLGVVESLLNNLQDKLKTLNKEQWQEYWQTAKSIMSGFNFKLFNKNEINGDAIVSELSTDLVNKIKGKTIGYIGDKTSATYLKLIDSGLEEGKDFTALTIDEMQGLEFDHVVIDHTFGEIQNPLSFLKDLYTLMSRGRESSIFIDHDLSSKIGTNKESEYLAKAPSLLEKVDGQSPVDQLRLEKILLLDQFDLSPIELKNPPTEEKKSESEEPKNPDEDFVDPDEKHLDEDIKKELEDEVSEDTGEPEIKPDTPVEETEEDPEEIIRELVNVDDIKDINSEFMIPSWSEVTYLGVQEEDVTIEEHGKDRVRKKWTISRPTTGPLRNLQALYEDGTTAIKQSEKLEKQRVLNILKSALLFNHTHFDENDNSDYITFPKEIRKNFSKEDWDQGKYYLEIRSTDGEVLPIYAKLPEIGMTYKGNKYIANIVFSVKNRDGQECRFDISGINNPETLIKNLGVIKQNITDSINKDASRPEERKRFTPEIISKLENIRDTIDTLATNYASKFDEWINEYETNGAFELDISDAIDFNKTTRLQRRKTPIRLGGLINPEEKILTEEEISALSEDEQKAYRKKQIRNLKTLNPDLVFSNIYTYSSKEGEIGSIDQGLKGKAVVFVSSDLMIRPDLMVNMYMSQKLDPAHNTPAVRMIVLGNYGMTFSQFHQPEFIRTFQGGDSDRKPLRLNFNGIGMFTSLWNWRAGLTKFNDALSSWKGSHGYDESKLNNILKAEQEIHDGGDTSTILSRYNVSLEDVDNLIKFNLEDLKELPIFRLGYSKNGNGFFVQQYDVRGSEAYKGKSNVSLLRITPEKARQFYEFTNDILNGIVPRGSNNTLGVKLQKEDGTDWGVDEFIDLDKAGHRRTLSKLLHLDSNYKLIISDGSQNLAFAKGDEWSMIPAFLSHIVRKTTALLLEDPNKFDEWEMANITHSKDDTKKASVQIGKWIKSGTLKSNPDEVEKLQDTSLLDMFDLMFHGTVEDIHKGNPLRLEDSRFKFGFFVNPDAKYVLENGKYKAVTIKGKKDSVFIEIETSDALFTSDVEVRSAGIGVNLSKLLGKERKVEPIADGSEEEIKNKLNDFYLKIMNASDPDVLTNLQDQLNNYIESIDSDKFASEIAAIQPALDKRLSTSFETEFPIGAELINKLNRKLSPADLYEMSYEGLLKAVYANNKKLIPIAIRDFLVNPDTETTGLYILQNDKDAEEVTLKGFVQSLLPGESVNMEVNDDSELIVNNKYKLVINSDSVVLEETEVKESPDDVLDDILDGKEQKLHDNIDDLISGLNELINNTSDQNLIDLIINVLNIINSDMTNADKLAQLDEALNSDDYNEFNDSVDDTPLNDIINDILNACYS